MVVALDGGTTAAILKGGDDRLPARHRHRRERLDQIDGKSGVRAEADEPNAHFLPGTGRSSPYGHKIDKLSRY